MSSLIQIKKPKNFIPLWLYKWLALMPFIGFFGIDHWALDSKFTGIAKLFVNVFTLGSWYAYDVVQAWNGIRADKKTLQSEGLDIPFFEGFNIGKGKFDAEPLTNMSNNTQMWLLILSIGFFIFIYYILSFYLTSTSGFFISSLASIAFYGVFALSAYTLFFFVMSRTGKFTDISTPKTSGQAKQAFYTSSGVVNPLSVPKTSSRTSLALGSAAPGLALPALPRMRGGSSMDGDSFNVISDLVDTLKTMEPVAYNPDHLYFISLLLIIPISGFAAYVITKNKKNSKKDEVSGLTRRV